MKTVQDYDERCTDFGWQVLHEALLVVPGALLAVGYQLPNVPSWWLPVWACSMALSPVVKFVLWSFYRRAVNRAKRDMKAQEAAQ